MIPLRPSEPVPQVSGSWEAWLVCHDEKLAVETMALLAREALALKVTWIAEVPSEAACGEWARTAYRKLCLFEVRSTRQETLNLLSRLREPTLNIPVVALLSADDSALALRCLRAGASGCLLRPFDGEQLRPILMRLGYAGASSSGRETGKVLCIIPAKGSVGATTVAVNLACHCAAAYKRLLLADMDPITSTMAFVLKLKASYSFADALAHAGQLDPDLWRGLVTPAQGFDVLLSPESPLDVEVAAGDVAALGSYARRTYGLIILDTSGAYGGLTVELARLSDEVLFVASSHLASIYAAKRALAHLVANGVPRSSFRLVLSRCRKGMGFDQEEIEKALDIAVSHVIPNDPKAVEDALLEGRPVGSGTPFGKSLAELASAVSDGASDAGRGPALKGLYSLICRKS